MAKTPVRLDKLRSVPLFKRLSEEALTHIAAACKEFEAPQSTVLIQPNLPGSGLYIIESGTVEVETPRRHIELGPGECLGELALLTDRPHAARVRATSEVKGVAISRSDFQKLLESEPELALSLLEVLAARLTETVNA